MAAKRKGMRQLRVELTEGEAPAHKVAINGEGVWMKPIDGKRGAKWRFLSWDDVARAASTTPYEPQGDES